MKRIALTIALSLVSFLSGQANVLLSDSFTYPDGPVVGASGSTWQNHSGTAGTALVTNRQLEVTFYTSRPEDVNALLAGGPYDGTINPAVTALYSSFKATFTALPSGPGSYFAHFKDSASGFRGRIYALTNGTSLGGNFRLAIASTNSASTSLGIATYPQDLSTGSTHKVVTRLDLTTGESALWIDPSQESDVSVSSLANPGTPLPMVAFAFRQAAGIGAMVVDDLKVGTSFEDVGGANNPPFISGLPNQVIPVAGATAALPFTIGDSETPVGNLVVTKESSDPALVPPDNIVLGGSDANRTVTVTSAPGLQGVTTITLTVTDGDIASASTSFKVSVGLPIISAIPNQITITNIEAGPIHFTVSDTETDADLLTVTGYSTNQALVPDASIVTGGAGSNRTVTLTPAADVAGLTLIRLVVSDGTSTATNSFVLTVKPLLGLLRSDDFNRANGPLVQLDGQWLSSSGTFQEMQIVDDHVVVTDAATEDCSTEMPPLQNPVPAYSISSGVVLYSGFKLNCQRLPTIGGGYFAHFRDGGTGFRCRLFATASGEAAGKYRLAVANNSATISANSVFAQDLETNKDYTVVLRYNVGTGESTLWVNPLAESSPSVAAPDGPFPVGIEGFTWRQNGNLGAFFVDDLKIGTAFSDVAEPRYSLAIIRTGPDTVEVSWPLAAGDAGYVLQSKGTVSEAWELHSDQGTTQGSRKVLTLSNPTSSRFFQLAK